MKVVYRDAAKILLRFEKGEEVMQKLAAFAKEENLPGAAASGIGAAERIVIARYNPRTKAYDDLALKDEFEIAALVGNIAWGEGAPIVHMHGVFSDRKFRALGGHVKRCVISATCETTLSVFNKRLERALDAATNLPLLAGS